MSRMFFIVFILAATAVSPDVFAGTNVVSHGRFTNVYVYPRNFSGETWEQHMVRLPSVERPGDATQFSRASIDRFTSRLMAPGWPSYFDTLYQYSAIHPPRFMGSGVASPSCVNAAMRDLHKVHGQRVMQWGTIRSLANCHRDGHDPSPQVNLIFSPDILLGRPALFEPDSTSEICGNGISAYHWSGLNMPDYTVMSTRASCVQSFGKFTKAFSHEIVELLTNPGGLGVTNFGKDEVADKCHNESTVWKGDTVTRYWSDFDNNCQPRLDPPSDLSSVTWRLGNARRKLFRFTGGGERRYLRLRVPARRTGASSDARVTRIQLITQTGKDDLDGGQRVEAELVFRGGGMVTGNINSGRQWNGGQTHAVILRLPRRPLRLRDITGITISTSFPGGVAGKNWDLEKAALVVSYNNSTGSPPPPRPSAPVVRTLLNRSGIPLVRLTGQRHDLDLRARGSGRRDFNRQVLSLDLIIDTGNDNLRGGRDNCDVTILLRRGRSVVQRNVNRGREWRDWSSHTVRIHLPRRGIRAGEITGVKLHTNFHGDNWNVQRVQLKATLR